MLNMFWRLATLFHLRKGRHVSPKTIDVVRTAAYLAGTDPTFSVEKLHRLLFYSDFRACAVLGTPITGNEYIRHRSGPRLPHLKSALRRMRAIGELHRHAFRFEGRPDVSLTGEETEVIARVVAWFWGKDERHVPREHTAAWVLTPVGRPIPYEWTYLALPVVSADDEAAALEIGDDSYSQKLKYA